MEEKGGGTEFDLQDSQTNEKGEKIKKRETWSRAFDFLLACIGFSVGLGNVWRFPYLCYKNGGESLKAKASSGEAERGVNVDEWKGILINTDTGAFLIPYLICVVAGAIPLFYLEVAVGQFMGVGGVSAWNLCPIFRGIGISTTVIVFFLNSYYNVILAWAFYYFFASFTSELPWTKCDPAWATEHCFEFKYEDPSLVCNLTDTVNSSGVLVNGTCVPGLVRDPNFYMVDPVTEYWENKVLSISDGIDEMGTVKWDLCLCLLLAWIIVYLCICKGIRSSGKVMYVTATAPYIFMLCLLIRNCLLEGAKEGIIYYIKPDLAKLGDIQVWVDAGTQIFFSYSISLGALTALGSYNKFNHNSYRDSILFSITNSGTSIFAGFIIFSILGHMAHVQNKDISEVAESGPGLAFIAYPMAVSQMPLSPLWSILFFLMIILLGLDSQFVGVEAITTAFVDQWPGVLRKGYRKEIFIAVACICQFLIGLSMVCPGGMYVFQLFDYYSGSRIILFVAAFMCVAVAWIYGINRFYDNIQMMLGWRIMPYMWICWTVISPVFCMTIFILSTINYSELEYVRPKGVYKYPQWAVGIGWAMAAFAAMWIPLSWIYHIVRYGRDWKTFKLCFKPMGLKSHQLRPQDYNEPSFDRLQLNDKNLPTYEESVEGLHKRHVMQKHPDPAFQGDNMIVDNTSL